MQTIFVEKYMIYKLLLCLGVEGWGKGPMIAPNKQKLCSIVMGLPDMLTTIKSDTHNFEIRIIPREVQDIKLTNLNKVLSCCYE